MTVVAKIRMSRRMSDMKANGIDIWIAYFYVDNLIRLEGIMVKDTQLPSQEVVTDDLVVLNLVFTISTS